MSPGRFLRFQAEEESFRAEEAKAILEHAAVLAGGMDKLAEEIQVNERVLQHFKEGKEPIPDDLFLKLVDVVLKHK